MQRRAGRLLPGGEVQTLKSFPEAARGARPFTMPIAGFLLRAPRRYPAAAASGRECRKNADKLQDAVNPPSLDFRSSNSPGYRHGAGDADFRICQPGGS
jgi:hypothetical protein